MGCTTSKNINEDSFDKDAKGELIHLCLIFNFNYLHYLLEDKPNPIKFIESVGQGKILKTYIKYFKNIIFSILYIRRRPSSYSTFRFRLLQELRSGAPQP